MNQDRQICRSGAQKAALINLADRTMNFIATGLESSGNDPATGASGLRRGHARFDLELCNRIRLRIDRDLTKLRFVVVHAVEREVVVRCARAIDNQNGTTRFTETGRLGVVLPTATIDEVSAATEQPKVWSSHAGRKSRQQGKVSLRNRKIRYLPSRDQIATYARLAFNEWS